MTIKNKWSKYLTKGFIGTAHGWLNHIRQPLSSLMGDNTIQRRVGGGRVFATTRGNNSAGMSFPQKLPVHMRRSGPPV